MGEIVYFFQLKKKFLKNYNLKILYRSAAVDIEKLGFMKYLKIHSQ
jgi:hypothetical protein